MKKKIFKMSMLIMPVIFLTGCTSNITAKFDDYNETFSGHSYTSGGKAFINMKSDLTGTQCIGNARIKVPFIWQFSLTCSDGRTVKGYLFDGEKEGKAFTNRNELITFTAAKRKKTINEARQRYYASVQNKPSSDKTKENVKVIISQ